MKLTMRGKIMGIMGRAAVLIITIILLALAYTYFHQDKMIYPGNKYRQDYEKLVPPRAERLDFKISCGKQNAWYVPPHSADDPTSVPARLWLMFGGNASLALFWEDVVAKCPDGDAGFLLVEYPGYGFCEGKPSPDSISEAADAALQATFDHLKLSEAQATAMPLRLIGHSLGTGVALAFARAHHVERIILVAPFTSFRAMANRIVSPLFTWLLHYNVDSLAAMKDISAQPNPPRVIVIHGSADNIVPVEMGRAFKEKFPDVVDYIEFPGDNHVNILDHADPYMAAQLPKDLSEIAEPSHP